MKYLSLPLGIGAMTLVLTLNFMTPAAASASCIAGNPQTYKNLIFDKGGYVFVGTITKNDLVSHVLGTNNLQTDTYQVTAHVERVWGVPTSYSDVTFKDSVTSPVPGSGMVTSDQDVPFKVGTRQVVWVSKNSNGDFTSSNGGCMWPPTVDTVASDMQAGGFAEGTVVVGLTDQNIPVSKTCPVLTHTLTKGMRDISSSGDVRSLQLFLSYWYKLNPADTVTGYFGPTTLANVIRFQTESSVSPVGIVGPLTRVAITRSCSK